eukprot:scaffold322993_cov27-Attheya_sp.AAC.1
MGRCDGWSSAWCAEGRFFAVQFAPSPISLSFNRARDAAEAAARADAQEAETGQETAICPGPVAHETASVSDAAPWGGDPRTWSVIYSWNSPGDTGSSWDLPRDGAAPSRWNAHDWAAAGSAQTLANRRARADPTRSWSAGLAVVLPVVLAMPRGDALSRVPIVEG